MTQDFNALGLRFDERWARLDESVGTLRALWRAGAPPFVGHFYSTEGVTIEPRLLEETLDALAHINFPINPQIIHGWPTIVEFPAYRSRLEDVRISLERHGIGAPALQINRMLEAILS